MLLVVAVAVVAAPFSPKEQGLVPSGIPATCTSVRQVWTSVATCWLIARLAPGTVAAATLVNPAVEPHLAVANWRRFYWRLAVVGSPRTFAIQRLVDGLHTDCLDLRSIGSTPMPIPRCWGKRLLGRVSKQGRLGVDLRVRLPICRVLCVRAGHKLFPASLALTVAGRGGSVVFVWSLCSTALLPALVVAPSGTLPPLCCVLSSRIPSLRQLCLRPLCVMSYALGRCC